MFQIIPKTETPAKPGFKITKKPGQPEKKPEPELKKGLKVQKNPFLTDSTYSNLQFIISMDCYRT